MVSNRAEKSRVDAIEFWMSRPTLYVNFRVWICGSVCVQACHRRIYRRYTGRMQNMQIMEVGGYTIDHAWLLVDFTSRKLGYADSDERMIKKHVLR